MPHCSCEKDCEKIVLVKRAPDQCLTLRRVTTGTTPGYTLQKGCNVYTAALGTPQDSDIPLCFYRDPSQLGRIFVAASRSNHGNFADFKDDEDTQLTLDDEECVLALLKDFANVTVDLVKLDNTLPSVILPFEIQKQVFFNAAQYDDAIEKEDASVALSSRNNCLC